VRTEKKMASNGNSRGKLLTAGGVLSIVAGIYLIVVGVSMAVRLMLASDIAPDGVRVWQEFIGYSPFPPFIVYWPSYRWVIIGGCVGILGIVAIVGGISAIRRRRFGLSLAGAICALPSAVLGILAVIFVSLSRKEFRAGD
jgi:hypothetical protein